MAANPIPPSAPVGVEGLARLLERIRDLLASLPVDCLGSGTDASGQPYPIRDEVIHGITKALAQQPAAVDEAAAIRAFEEHFEASAEDPSLEGELELWLTAWRKALDSAPQQPVAVDVAAAKRAVAAVMSAPDGISVEAFFRIVLEAAVAAQHQDPTT